MPAMTSRTLVAEDLHFADWFKDRPLIYPILCRAAAFSILFLVFDVVEEVLVGVFKGKTIAELDRRAGTWFLHERRGDHPSLRATEPGRR